MPDPIQFILLGNARCGSNLLVGALMEHPQVRMVSEVLSPFADTRQDGWEHVNPAAWTYPRGAPYQIGEDGAEFLARRVFAPDPAIPRRAYGFKLFQNHARFDEHVRTAWDYVLSNPIHVVYMMRRNLLAALLSREVAARTRSWSRRVEDRSPAPPPPPPFTLDPAVCQAYFDQIRDWRAWIQANLPRHPMLTVEYERDLCGDFNATAGRVFAFLGLEPKPAAPGLVKQQKLTARQQLSNFDDLRSHFRDTPFAEFFE